MQVHNIQGVNTRVNTRTNSKTAPSFGYNPTTNAALIKILESQKKNKAYYNFVRDIVNTTNNAEQSLRDAEIKNKPYLQSFLIASFMPIKISLTNMVNGLFPMLNYRQKEIESYSEEIESNELVKQNENHWMRALVAALSEYHKQDEAAKMADVLSSLMHEIFPNQKFDFSGLAPMFRQHYIDNEEDIDETEDGIISDLEKSIELGKSKVEEYIPTPVSEQGFASLGGMRELKETLNDKIVGVLKDPAQARMDNIEYGKKIPRGVLLYGPPGTGKTTVVEHLSTEAGVPLLKLKAGKLKDSWAHESAKNTLAAFDYAASIATPEKPVLMMIDDADAMFAARSSRMEQWEAEELNTFLDAISAAADKNVMVVATTNKYDILDDAVKSRFDEQIYVGLPDEEARVSILKLLLNQRTKGKALAENDEEIQKVAKMLNSFAIREIIGITNRASNLALKDGRRDITSADYEKIVAESQNLKVKEENYKTNATRRSIGF